MNPINPHHSACARASGRAAQTVLPARRHRLRLRRKARPLARAGILGAAATAAIVLANPLAASAMHMPHPARAAVGRGSISPADDGRLEATFISRPVSVTPNLGMVDLIVTGTGSVNGFGAATQVVGVVEDQTASPCGAGGASDSAERRIVMQGGVLELHEVAALCVTASGPRITGTYRVDGLASTGIFAGARGAGDVAIDPATGRDTVSGTLILTGEERDSRR